MKNNPKERKTFDVTFTWKELCMATVTVESNSLEEAKTKVLENISDYLDYCINNGSTEVIEREYETLNISYSKESDKYNKKYAIKDFEIGLD